MSTLPIRPRPVVTELGWELQEQIKTDMVSIGEELQAEDDRRDEIYKVSREILKSAAKISFVVRNGQIHKKEIDIMVNKTSAMVSDLLAKVVMTQRSAPVSSVKVSRLLRRRE